MSSQPRQIYSVRSRFQNDDEKQRKFSRLSERLRQEEVRKPRRSKFEDSHDRREEEPKVEEFKDLRQLLNNRRNKINGESIETRESSSVHRRLSIRVEGNSIGRTKNSYENANFENSSQIQKKSINFVQKSLNLSKNQENIGGNEVKKQAENAGKKEERIRKPIRIRNPAGCLADLVRLQVVDAVQKNQRKESSSSSSIKSNSQESLIEISSTTSSNEDEKETKKSFNVKNSKSSEFLSENEGKRDKMTLREFLLGQKSQNERLERKNWIEMMQNNEIEDIKSETENFEDKKSQKSSEVREKSQKSSEIDEKSVSEIPQSFKSSLPTTFKEFYPRNYQKNSANQKFSGSLSDENVNTMQFAQNIQHSASYGSIYQENFQQYPHGGSLQSMAMNLPENFQQANYLNQNFNFQEFHQIPSQFYDSHFDYNQQISQNFYQNFTHQVSPTFSSRSDSPTESISSITGGPSKLEARLRKIRGDEKNVEKNAGNFGENLKNSEKFLRFPQNSSNLHQNSHSILINQPTTPQNNQNQSPSQQFSPTNFENFDKTFQNHENLIKVPICDFNPKEIFTNTRKFQFEGLEEAEEFVISHHSLNLCPYVSENELIGRKVDEESESEEKIGENSVKFDENWREIGANGEKLDKIEEKLKNLENFNEKVGKIDENSSKVDESHENCQNGENYENCGEIHKNRVEIDKNCGEIDEKCEKIDENQEKLENLDKNLPETAQKLEEKHEKSRNQDEKCKNFAFEIDKIPSDCQYSKKTSSKIPKLTHDQLVNLLYITKLVPKYFGEAMNYYLEYYEELGIKLDRDEVRRILKLKGMEHNIKSDDLKLLG